MLKYGEGKKIVNKNEKNKWNVLIYPGGMENGLEIQNSLRYCKEISLFSASSNVVNHAFYVYKNNHIIRDVFTEGWIQDLNKIIIENKIDIVYPANSLIIDHLSLNRDLISAPILLPNHNVIALTRSKRATLEVLSGQMPQPEVYSSFNEIKKFPVFSKPDRGYGGQGALLINSSEEAKSLDFVKSIVQEYLPGKEYTIDCFSTTDGKLLFSGARERSRIRMGTSMHAESVHPDLENEFRSYAEIILSKIKISGGWFFQMKEDSNGNLKLMEIDIRIAGTMCFNRCRGVNFPLLAIYDFFGKPISTLTNPHKLSLDRSLKNRYIFDFNYKTVYVDLDDTIIIHGLINTQLIQFFYQCLNTNKKIILISKSLQEDKVSYLKKWRIFDIFDEIHWLTEDQSKAAFIIDRESIYIDDSFQQRLEVANNIGIPTFDASMVEALIDERY